MRCSVKVCDDFFGGPIKDRKIATVHPPRRHRSDDEPPPPPPYEAGASRASACIFFAIAIAFAAAGWLVVTIGGAGFVKFGLVPFVAAPVFAMLGVFGLIDPRVTTSILEGNARVPSRVQMLQVIGVLLGVVGMCPCMGLMLSLTR